MSIKRDITTQASKYLESDEILIFIGSRQSGKTTILKQLIEILDQKGLKSFWLNLEDPEYLNLLNENPKNLFKIFTIPPDQKSYIFIDEVQYLKNPSNFLKYLFDEHREQIKLIVSGSSSFYLDNKFKDSLAGRKNIFPVYTLSFREFLRFKSENDLSEANLSKLSINDQNKVNLFYREYINFGGYPKIVLAPQEEKIDLLREIAFSYIKKDIFEAGIRQDEIFYKLFKILADQTGNLVNSMELAGTLGVSKTAIDHYLYAMQKSFHIVLVRPFYKNIRKEITKMPKVYFLDLGLRNFFTDNFQAFESRDDKGALLENAVFRQLIEKSQIDDIHYWRTTTQKEVDFVISNEAFEVKADPQNFNPKKYQEFQEEYPEINLKIISFDQKTSSVKSIPIIEPWSI